MAKKKHTVNKKTKKHMDGKCRFCPCDTYELLDLHRISYGKEYSDFNTITVCALCHRKIHADLIKIDRNYPAISGRWVLHYWINGEEFWD